MRQMVTAVFNAHTAFAGVLAKIDTHEDLARINAADRAALAHCIEVLEFMVEHMKKLDSVLAQLPQFKQEKMS